MGEKKPIWDCNRVGCPAVGRPFFANRFPLLYTAAAQFESGKSKKSDFPILIPIKTSVV